MKHVRRTYPPIPNDGGRRISVLNRSAALCAWLVLVMGGASFAEAQTPSILAPGDAAVTGFSGTVAPDTPPPGDPLDETFINPDGISMRLQRIAPSGPPAAQVAPSPPVLEVKARDVGQVFAIALDQGSPLDPAKRAPNIYLTATSAFGLQIAIPDSDGDGRPERVKNGHPNAEWMPGQFGLDKGGGPGSIWKVDGATGAVTLFSTIPGNGGAGLGDIVYDKTTRQFFVSDLDTGLIHRLDASGALIDTFDHGVMGRPAAGLPVMADDGMAADIKNAAFNSENAATWGFTLPERRVWGLGIRAGRLYYAVAEGPEIWSVSIDLDGAFGKDARREIVVSGTPSDNPISDIAFDEKDHMYVAQRGAAEGSWDYTVFADSKKSVVFRFKRETPDDPATPGIWVPVPDEYAVGFPPDHRNTTGGLSLGLGYNEAGVARLGSCNQFLWTTGDSLRDDPARAAELAAGGPAVIHGLQGNALGLVRPDNEPPFKTYFADYDGVFDDPEKQGHVGDVEVWQPCEGEPGFTEYTPGPGLPPWYYPPGDTPPPPPPPVTGEETNLRIDKRAAPQECLDWFGGWLCYYTVRVTNTGPGIYDAPLFLTDWLPEAPAGALVGFGPAPWVCGGAGPAEMWCHHPGVYLFPGDHVDLDVAVLVPKPYPRCYLTNAVRIDWAPPGSVLNINPFDDEADAIAAIPEPGCKPEGEETNLEILKEVHPAGCAVKGSGEVLCSFEIKIRNEGPADYNGILQIQDEIPDGAVFHGPQGWGWDGCVGGPTAYVCTRAATWFPAGSTTHFTAVVELPKDLVTQLGCKIPNEVEILSPVGGIFNTDPTDDTSGATADLFALLDADALAAARRKGLCPVEALEEKKQPIVNACPQGWSKTPVAGKCCPPRSAWDGQRCKRGIPPPPSDPPIVPTCPANSDRAYTYPDCRCKPGYRGRPPYCRPIVETCQKKECGRGERWDNEKCSCVDIPSCAPKSCPGGAWDQAKCACVDAPTCPANSDRAYRYPDCRCKPGYRGRPPYCRPIVETCQKKECGRGERWDDEKCSCVDIPCPAGTIGNYPDCRKKPETCESNKEWIDGACRCRSPLKWDGKRCVAEPPKECPANSVGKYPYCRCKPGTQGRPPYCRPVVETCKPKACGRGAKWDQAKCECATIGCPPGQRRHAPTGLCVGDCPAGQTGWPNCKSTVKPCPKGTEGPGQPNCKPIKPVVKPCPKGTVGPGQPNCRPIKPVVKPCPKGTVGPGQPNCRPIKPIVKPCPKGTVGPGQPNCRPIKPTVKPCPKGTVGPGQPNCKPIKPIVKPCPPGTFGPGQPNCKKQSPLI